MLQKQLTEIVAKILDIGIMNLEIREATDPVYGEIDPKTEEVIEESLRKEYDLLIKEELCHREIQQIDELLSSHSNVEMRLRDGELEIFSKM